MTTLQGFTWAELDALFDYHPITGCVSRRVARSNQPVGVVVGTRDGKGYLHVSVGKKFIRIHRLAWFLVHKETPLEIDHRNTVKTDNRLCNLRAADRRGQAGNIRPPKHNTSGFKGVSQNSRSGKWHAQIKVGGKQTYLGRFDTPEGAAEAYRKAAAKHFGEFARAA